MLATEREAQHAPVSEQVPRSPLGHFHASPQVACTLQLRPRDRRTPEPHLRTITRSGREGIGRAAGRERGEISVGAGSFKKKKRKRMTSCMCLNKMKGCRNM